MTNDELKEQLEAVQRESGVLNAATVVTSAEEESSPLHGFFEWDDTEAGRLYREHQARNLIDRVKVRYVDEDGRKQTTRAFVAVRGDDPLAEYVSVEVALSEPQTAADVLAAMRRDMEVFVKRYKGIEGLAEVLAKALKEAA
jgi:hypothetical protein